MLAFCKPLMPVLLNDNGGAAAAIAAVEVDEPVDEFVDEVDGVETTVAARSNASTFAVSTSSP